MNLSAKQYIENKPLFYKEIKYENIYIAFTLLKKEINIPQTIHIIGTNGKGSTGRTVAHLLYKSNYNVIHYSSPHIFSFNERIWINGEDITDEYLEQIHKKLFNLLGKTLSDKLTYFEYTTLLTFIASENSDILVLEAGLGGEFDATNVADKDLTIVTPIGLDHQSFLGNTIQEIATTKINSIQKSVLLSMGTNEEVKEITKAISTKKKAEVYYTEDFILDIKIASIEEKGFRDYLLDNILTAISAIKLLNLNYSLSDLDSLKLFGRFYKLDSNITIDVGHNPLSATVIKKALKSRKIILIYNTLEDKDFKKILSILKDNIIHIEIIDINNDRALDTDILTTFLDEIHIKYKKFELIDKNNDYLVYGSFFTVEAFLKSYNFS